MSPTSRRAALKGALAAGAGRLLRSVHLGWRAVGGAGLTCYGLYEIYPPAAALAAGGFLLLLDWRS